MVVVLGGLPAPVGLIFDEQNSKSFESVISTTLTLTIPEVLEFVFYALAFFSRVSTILLWNDKV